MSKALRIGVVLAGEIVEERLFSRGDKLTVGASPRNDIFLPSSTLPRSISLFSRGRGGWALRYAAGMDGRLSQGGQLFTLGEAAACAQASPGRGGVTAIPLAEEDRGKVRLGDVTLLFQFVDPPPAPPRPQLPPSVRGGVITNIDWVLACCFLTIGLLHGGALAYMKTLDFPVNPEIQPILVRAIQGFIPQAPPVMMDPDKASQLGEAPIKPKPAVDKPSSQGQGRTKKPRPAAPCDQTCQDARAAKRRAALTEQMRRLVESKIFGSNGPGRGIVSDLLKDGDPGQAIEKAFEQMNGLTLSSKGKLHGLKRRGGDGEGKVIKAGNLGLKGPEAVNTGRMVKERVPTGSVKANKPVIETGEMSAGSTYRIIRGSMRCVQTQYQRGLKSDPELQGKLSLCLKVDPMGRVGKVAVEEDTIGSPSLVMGVSRCLGRLRFPPHAGGMAEVCVPLLLKPAN